MNATNLVYACLLTALGIVSLGAQAADTPTIEHYHYGQNLDVKEVIAITEDSPAPFTCGLVNERLDYLDSQGVEHHLSYKALASNCNDGG